VEIEGFLHSIHGLVKGLDAAKHLYREQFSPEFTVFDFIRGDENRLSAILGWLLDPNGSHGQGTKFLDAFVVQLEPPFEWSQEMSMVANIRREFLTRENRRIDLLVWAGNRSLLKTNHGQRTWTIK
jgi:hypothetical protein